MFKKPVAGSSSRAERSNTVASIQGLTFFFLNKQYRHKTNLESPSTFQLRLLTGMLLSFDSELAVITTK